MSKWTFSPAAQTVYRVLGLHPDPSKGYEKKAKETLKAAKEKRLGKNSSRGSGRE